MLATIGPNLLLGAGLRFLSTPKKVLNDTYISGIHACFVL